MDSKEIANRKVCLLPITAVEEINVTHVSFYFYSLIY